MCRDGIGEALQNWRKKKAYFERELAITASPTQKYELKHRITECKGEIQRLEEEIQQCPDRYGFIDPLPLLPDNFEYPSIPIPPISPPPISDSPIDNAIYNHLENFLVTHKWEEADRETLRVFLKLSDRLEEENPWLRPQDIKKLPCSCLKTIDRLWTKHSNNRFGFSVQRKIWQQVGGQLNQFNGPIFYKFGDRVGWRKQKQWLKRDELEFTLSASAGHLPSFTDPNASGREVGSRKDSFTSFLPRLNDCLSG